MALQQRKSYYPWIIWLLAAAFFFSEYFARVSPSAMSDQLMGSFHMTALGIGTLTSLFYFAYVGMQLPVGSLTDRFGARKLLTINAFVCGAGCVIFSQTHTLAAADASRFFMGISAAFAFVGALKLASTWFPMSRFGFFAGCTQAIGMLGAATGEGPVTMLTSHIGWRYTMLLMGAVLIGLAILIGVFVRDKPELKEKPVTREPIWMPLLKNFWVVIKNGQTWINGAVVGFLYAPTAALAGVWGTTYLHQSYHLSRDDAALAMSLVFIGWGISSPIMGWLSDRIQSRKKIILGSIIMSAITFTLAIYNPGLPAWSLYPLMLLYGISNVGVATCYAVACESNDLKVGGTAMSFANMASVIIGAMFQPLIGWLLDLNWQHIYHHGIPSYSLRDFHTALLALPACFILSLVAWFFLKESFAMGHSTPHRRESVDF